jgi:hypothetical protein
MIKAWLTQLKNKLQARAENSEKEAIAKAFNDRYTYRVIYTEGRGAIPGRGDWGMKVSAGYAWMCPSCNNIYYPMSVNGITGLQYPNCCKTPAGHRLHNNIRAD